jgi:formate/nitrite transporter FocA (FNT family)
MAPTTPVETIQLHSTARIYMVFEHSIVNMFLFPSGLMLQAPFSIMDYFIWNEIPTVLGNLVGGISFTGLTLYATHVKTAPKRAALRRVA